uniref:RNase H type-1 domain-containing protein n=1 Tax=Cannabis sativa TaxID=3483 RepID=A0A803PCM4_CANSA
MAATQSHVPLHEVSSSTLAPPTFSVHGVTTLEELRLTKIDDFQAKYGNCSPVVCVNRRFLPASLLGEGVKMGKRSSVSKAKDISLGPVEFMLTSSSIKLAKRLACESGVSQEQMDFFFGVFGGQDDPSEEAFVRDALCQMDSSKSLGVDRVKWRFLKRITLKLGFQVDWVRKVLDCISLVEYSILLNGVILVSITSQWGLRQGDPMFAYLFLLCAEGFSGRVLIFWWGGIDVKKKIHWCIWDKLCLHEEDGVMGFRDLYLFIQALLAKQAARIYNVPTCLASRVLKDYNQATHGLLSDGVCPLCELYEETTYHALSIKVNSDATIDKIRAYSGLGMVVRDHLGTVLASTVWRLKGCLDNEVAEALALQNVMVQCLFFGYDNIIFKMDCLNILQKMVNKVSPIFSLDLVLDEIGGT